MTGDGEPTRHDQPVVFDEVLRLDVKPGDTLVLRTDEELSAQVLDEIHDVFARLYGSTVKVMVLEGGLRLEGVVSELPDAPWEAE